MTETSTPLPDSTTPVRESIDRSFALVEERHGSLEPLRHGDDLAGMPAEADKEKKEDSRKPFRASWRDAVAKVDKQTKQRDFDASIKSLLARDMKDLTHRERQQLTRQLVSKFDDPENEKARREVLKELRALEPKRKDKPETEAERSNNQRAAIEKAMRRVGEDVANDPKAVRKALSQPEHREVQNKLRERFGGEPLPKILERFASWWDRLQAAPATAWQQLAQQYALHLSQPPKPENSKGKPSALDRAFASVADFEGLESWIKNYGGELPELIRRAEMWDAQLRADPWGAAARLASSFGGVEGLQQAQQRPVTEEQQAYNETAKTVQSFIDSGRMPAIANERVADAVSFVLENMGRTDDPYADLQSAYDFVVLGKPLGQAAGQVRASKSISGAPSSGHLQPAQAPSTSNRAAIERAWR
jgi:hypothetical protein